MSKEFNELVPTLYLIRGVSGSGKTTLSDQMFNSGMVQATVEADSYFYNENDEYLFDCSKLQEAHTDCYNSAEIALKNLMSVAVSNTSVTNKEVLKYQELARKYNANFVSLIVENRNNTKDVHSLTQETLDRQKRRFDIRL